MIHHMVPLVIESKSVTVLFVPMAGKQLEEMWTPIRKNKITAGGFLYRTRPLLPLSY